MMTTIVTAGTGDQDERIARCRAGLRELHRSEHHFEADRSAPFDLHIELHALGALRLVEIRGSPLQVSVASGGDDDVLVLMVCSGCGSVWQDGYEVILEPGTLYLLRASDAVELHLREDFHHLALRVPRARMDECFPEWPAMLLTAITVDRGPAAMLCAHFDSVLKHRDSLSRADLKGVTDALISLLVTTLAAYWRAGAEGLSRIERYHLERVKTFARARLADPELDVRMIADGTGLSPSYLHRLFLTEPLRLMQWVAAERLEACHRELSAATNRKRPIFLIAQRWGFASQAHFSRVFRARFGVSPKDVRDRQPAGATPPIAEKCDTDANIGSLSDKCAAPLGC